MKYGDAVVFVQKQVDGSIRRANAIVLASRIYAPIGQDRRPVAGADKEEHVDLAFPVLSLAPEGYVLKTRNLEEIFRPAYDVRQYVEGAWVGFELPAVTDRIEGSPRDESGQQFGEASETIANLRYDLRMANTVIEQLQAERIVTFPTTEGAVTSSGKTQDELDADHAEQKASEALPSAADLDAVTAEQQAAAETADPAVTVEGNGVSAPAAS